jgi:hypothetical protein
MANLINFSSDKEVKVLNNFIEETVIMLGIRRRCAVLSHVEI